MLFRQVFLRGALGLWHRCFVHANDAFLRNAVRARRRLDVPHDLPFVPEGAEPAFRLVTRGSEQADEHEIAENPRAASVRLRAVERVRPTSRPASRFLPPGAVR